MGNDIYGVNAEYKSAPLLKASEMLLTINAPIGEEYLVQNITLNYGQPIQTLREIGSGNAYYLTNPPQGSLTMERVVGTKPISSVLGAPGSGIWTVGGSNEEGRTCTLAAKGNITGSKYTMHGCIVTNFGVNTNANNPLVQEDVQIMFGKLSIT